MIVPVRNHTADIQLSIEIDSDPIRGLVSVGAGDPRSFAGWMELVAAIEAARSEAGNPGVVPWGEGARSGLPFRIT